MPAEPGSGDLEQSEGPERERPWQPLSARLGGTPIDKTWQDGIPPWIQSAVRKWLDYQLSTSGTRDRLFARFHFTDKTAWGDSPVRYLDEADLLDWIDAVLDIDLDEEKLLARIKAERLEVILREGHSIWKVSEACNSLERRQDETVTAAVHQTCQTVTSYGRPAAAERLHNAWSKAYGLHPDPSRAFSEAILAVEAVAVPAITPGQSGATLGHVYGQLRHQGPLYELAISNKTGDRASVDSVTQLVGLLWEGHTDRHEGNLPAVLITQEAAEMAVHAAATLVQWFASGAIRRKSV